MAQPTVLLESVPWRATSLASCRIRNGPATSCWAPPTGSCCCARCSQPGSRRRPARSRRRRCRSGAACPADAGSAQDAGVDPRLSPGRVGDALALAVAGSGLDELVFERLQVERAVGRLQLAAEIHALLDQ